MIEHERAFVPREPLLLSESGSSSRSTGSLPNARSCSIICTSWCEAVDEAGGYGMLMGPSPPSWSARTSRGASATSAPLRGAAPVELSIADLGPEPQGGGSPEGGLRPYLLFGTRACAARRLTGGAARGSTGQLQGAARRTPGCSSHDLARRRSLLLVRTLHGAGQSTRASSRSPRAGHRLDFSRSSAGCRW